MGVAISSGKLGLAFVAICTFIFGSLTHAFSQEGQQLKARGLVRSDARIELRSDLMAMVTSSQFREGMTFEKGDTLISFDCRKHQAELNSAKAAARGANIELRNKINLRKNGAAGKSPAVAKE